MIDYQLIDQSIKFYEKEGFQRIETPWTVTGQVSAITKPPNAQDFKIENKNKVLVASAEQGFLYLYLKGFLPFGQYQSCGACFRDEVFDTYHTKYFIKNELIKTDSTTEGALDNVIETACRFFRTLFPKENIEIEKIEKNQFDIFYLPKKGNAVELGSYGIRECEFLKWIYGTGCAEPRTSSVLKLIK